jgi:hypothetical protein
VRITQKYSHLNGEEFLRVHRPHVLDEIIAIIEEVDVAACSTKISRERTMRDKRLISPRALNARFHSLFYKRPGWAATVYRYCVTTDRNLLERISMLPLREQRKVMKAEGVPEPIVSYKQTDFVKERIAVEVQFGKYVFVAYDLFVKHMLFYSGNVIDVGLEILPTKSMLEDPRGGRRMSTGIAYFEGEVYNVLRHGRSNPPVPLLILGVEP